MNSLQHPEIEKIKTSKIKNRRRLKFSDFENSRISTKNALKYFVPGFKCLAKAVTSLT